MSTDEPRRLDADEQATWMAPAGLTVQLPAALDAQLQRDAEISHFEYQVLAGLSMTSEHTLRMSVLAEFATASLSRLSHTVKRLEKQGWVRRTPDPEDGRCTLAVLTDAGWDKVVATFPGHVAEVRRLVFDSLTKAQQRQLREAARRITNTVRPDAPCPGPGRD